MEVVIAGAGSIGLMFGSFLAENGYRVSFLVRRAEQAERLEKEGLVRYRHGVEVSRQKVKAIRNETDIPVDALIIIAVKTGGLTDVVNKLRNLPNPLLFIQNGLSHYEMAMNLDATSRSLAFATVEHGAERLGDNMVAHHGIGFTKIAVGRGIATDFRWFETLRSEEFPVEFYPNAEKLLLRKVIVNCLINPLTAILLQKNGELQRNRHSKELFNQLYDEIMAVFPEMKTDLPYDQAAEICQRTASNTSSMLTDRMRGNPMEIDAIVGALIRKAEDRGGALPMLSIFEKLLVAMDGAGGLKWSWED
ncbi:2-dehydropantoate 2-reductase [Sporosarcina sp. NCCP-2222]|uniref:ketopantoate reductase family protein n=1 Tax=Sporosarcina sp. NCCP-2222 TaxID=2935073 RepID=UPI002084ABC7|nr:2-dehydropantoate 2-reductase [Sporosarcina sp. NCCP-2222]GKV55687.1 2-dehydropantoate 2-reductase [Sporosarcina sp. NCCP-2222]